jgi:hypothetical protein
MASESTSSESPDDVRALVQRMRDAAWHEAMVNRAMLNYFREIQVILRDRVQRCDRMLKELDAIPKPEVEESEIPW